MPGIKRWEGRFTICVVGWAVALFGCAADPANEQHNLPYRLSVAAHFSLPSPSSYKFADLDGIEGAEIISISGSPPKCTLQFYRQPNTPPINKFEFSGRLISDSTPLDIDGDGRKEYFICEQTEGCAVLYAVWPFEKNRLQKIYSMNCSRDSTGNNASIHVRDLVDVNGDGEDELIFYVTSNAGQPANLIAMTLATGKRVWRLKLTGRLNDYARINYDDDRQEILLATVGLDSKLRAYNTGTTTLDDKHSYFVIVNGNTGAGEFVHSFGQSATEISFYSPAELQLPSSRSERDAHFLVVVRQPDRSGSFEFWDIPARKPVIQQLIPELKWHFIADINRDHKREIVFMNRSDNWQAFDTNLQPLDAFPKSLAFPPSVTVPALPDNQPPMPIRLPGSSGATVGIVAQFSNRAGFMVFDERLQPLAIWDEGLSGEFSTIHRGKYDDLFWDTPRQEHVYFFHLTPVAKFDLARFGRITLLILVFAAAVYFLYWYLRKRNEYAVDRWLQAMQGLEIGACVLQPPGRIAKINQQGRKILGLGDQDVSQRQIQEVLAGHQYVELCNIANNGVHDGAFMPQSCVLHEAHTEKEIEVMKASLVSLGERNRLEVLLLRDVTAQYAARKATFWAKTAQKLAHDLKNPLSSIMMAVDHLSRERDQKVSLPDQPDNNYLDHIRSEVTRMRKHTIGFVKFAELEKPKFEPLAANDLLISAAMTFEPMFGDRIQLNKELEEKLPLILVDAKQIRIVLNNLLDNAIAAMSRQGNGVLTLRSYLVTSLPDSEGHAPQYVAMEIHDTGCGIPPEILQSINEQKLFVTTKPDGTGVGLVQVQQIIADHHGLFELKSTPGVGTMVYLAMPTYREA